jgi:lysophospholipase L1-like esterase
VALFIGLFASVAVSASRIRLELPADRPEAFLAGDRNWRPKAAGPPPVVVCAGDSITQGAVSTDWVSILRERRPDLAFVNAGVNSEMAWNLAQRLGPIVDCDPDRVILLIGTNDANASLGFSNTLGYLAMYKLPEAPTEAFFRTT